MLTHLVCDGCPYASATWTGDTHPLEVMIPHPVLGQFLVFRTGATVVAVRINGYSSTRSKDSSHFDVFRIHQPDQVLHDDVHTVLVKVTVVAETEQIQFQTLAFHHLHIRQIADTDFRKIRLSGNRTQTGKLRAVETYPIIILRMLVDKSLEHLGCIILLVGGGLTQHRQFIFSFHTSYTSH